MVNMWLIGDTISDFPRTHLPLALDVLNNFFHHQRILGETVDSSAKRVATELEIIWSETGIDTMLSRNIMNKIKGLKEKYDSLKKSRFRKTEIQSMKEDEFKVLLNSLFDISSRAGLVISKEQQQFLEDQKGPRQLNVDSIKPLAAPFILLKEAKMNQKEVTLNIRYHQTTETIQTYLVLKF